MLSQEVSSFHKKFGVRLKEFRERLGMTQAELGSHLGVTFQQVQKYENGSNKIPLESVVKLCELFKITPNQLLALDDDYEGEKIISTEDIKLLNSINKSIDIKKLRKFLINMRW